MPVTMLLHLSEYAATQSSISHYAKRIDNEAQGKKRKSWYFLSEWSYRVSGKAVYVMIWRISDLS